jgi:hypothetical protein
LLEIATTGEDADFKFEVKETDIVLMDKDTNNVTGVQEGETTVSPKNQLL